MLWGAALQHVNAPPELAPQLTLLTSSKLMGKFGTGPAENALCQIVFIARSVGLGSLEDR